jgi:hypothetical protein
MSDSPRTDEVWRSMHGSGYQMMLLAEKLERELAAKDAELSEAKKKYLLVCAQHGRLVDQVYEEDGETLKQERLQAELEKEQLWGKSQSVRAEQAESCADAAYDLLRECLDWGLPVDLKERIDVVIGKKK